MYAGFDWSGTPLPKEKRLALDIYAPCGVVVPEVATADAFLADWRRRRNYPATFEFHGHLCTEAELLYAMEYVLENLCVIAMLLDKQRLAEEMGPAIFQRSILLPPATARPTVSRILQLHALGELWLDEDIAKGRRAAFDTDVKREARTLRPGTHLNIKHRPSDKSSLIQLADMTVYVLQRQERGSFQMRALRQMAKALWRKEGNEIWWGSGSDLRPYL